MSLKCFLALFSITISLPLIITANVSTITCDHHRWGPIGCPPDTHMVCHNATNECHCDVRSDYGILFNDTIDGHRCLPLVGMDQKCLISGQCLKSAKNQLYCYYLDANLQRLVKLDPEVAIDYHRRYNRTADGFCRCDDHHYYDYDRNQCRHQNASRGADGFDLNLSPIFEEYFCSQCPTIDENSFCDRKSRNCLCNEGFAKNSFGKCVRMRQLYEKCHQSDECVVDNAYCEPIVEECICSTGYIPDAQKHRCLKGRALFDKCAAHRECNYPHSHCDATRSQCLCDNASVLLNTYSPVCVKRTPYGQLCHHRLPDVVCQLSTRHSVCNKYTNRCICENGFIFIDNECQKMTAFGDEYHELEANKNPMTYIVIVFCTVFGFTIFASVLIKTFRKPFSRTQLALYDINNTLNQMQANGGPPAATGATTRLPAAPPVYTESVALTVSSGTHPGADSEDKPPSYEEAISGQFAAS